MDRLQVSLTRHAIADLGEIPKPLQDQILKNLQLLESAPLPSGTHIKRLKGFKPPVYRLRSGDFRVLYQIQSDVVTILRIIDRKLLERVIRRLHL